MSLKLWAGVDGPSQVVSDGQRRDGETRALKAHRPQAVTDPFGKFAGRCQARRHPPVSAFSMARQPQLSLLGLFYMPSPQSQACSVYLNPPEKEIDLGSKAMAIKAKLAAGPACHGQTNFGQQGLHCSGSVIDHVFRRFLASRATRSEGTSALR